MDMGVSQNLGYHFGDPHNKDYSILGSILGPLFSGIYHMNRYRISLMVSQNSRVHSKGPAMSPGMILVRGPGDLR